jgi:hypothetical protein
MNLDDTLIYTEIMAFFYSMSLPNSTLRHRFLLINGSRFWNVFVSEKTSEVYKYDGQ